MGKLRHHGSWSRADSAALDEYTVRSRAAALPKIQPDPRTWEAFAEDREAHGTDRLPVTDLDGRFRPACRTCGAPMRPRRSAASDHPNTHRAYFDGYCEPCVRKAESAEVRTAVELLDLPRPSRRNKTRTRTNQP